MADWNAALTDWLKPFVEELGHKKRRQMCPLYGVYLGDKCAARCRMPGA
jgi:hypothetical protein